MDLILNQAEKAIDEAKILFIYQIECKVRKKRLIPAVLAWFSSCLTAGYNDAGKRFQIEPLIIESAGTRDVHHFCFIILVRGKCNNPYLVNE